MMMGFGFAIQDDLKADCQARVRDKGPGMTSYVQVFGRRPLQRLIDRHPGGRKPAQYLHSSGPQLQCSK